MAKADECRKRIANYLNKVANKIDNWATSQQSPRACRLDTFDQLSERLKNSFIAATSITRTKKFDVLLRNLRMLGASSVVAAIEADYKKVLESLHPAKQKRPAGHRSRWYDLDDAKECAHDFATTLRVVAKDMVTGTGPGIRKRGKDVLNKQVDEFLKSSPENIKAYEIAETLNKNYAGVYRPTSGSSVSKTENWKQRGKQKKNHKKK